MTFFLVLLQSFRLCCRYVCADDDVCEAALRAVQKRVAARVFAVNHLQRPSPSTNCKLLLHYFVLQVRRASGNFYADHRCTSYWSNGFCASVSSDNYVRRFFEKHAWHCMLACWHFTLISSV